MLTTGYEHEVRKIIYPNPSCPEPGLSDVEGCLRGEIVFFIEHSNLGTVADQPQADPC